MKRFLSILIWAVLIMGVGLWVYLTFVGGTGEIELVEEKVRVVPVTVAPVAFGSISEILEISGEIEANKKVIIKSKVAGRLEKLQTVSDQGRIVVPVKEGVFLKKGQEIAVIDHDEYLARVRSAKAALAVSKAALESKRVTLNEAEREMARWVTLSKKGFASEQKSDRAVADYNRALAAKALAKARVREAKAALDLFMIQFRESTIVSSISGVVTQRHIDEGNMVDRNTAIVTVEDIRTVKARVGVPERYLKSIRPGVTPASIKVDAFPEKEFPADVVAIYPGVDRQTRTLQVELKIANDETQLRPGMFARVFFILAHKDNTVVVDEHWVLGRKGGERYVYLSNDFRAHRVPVKLGLKQGALLEVVEGLKRGDRLVTSGMNYLRDGYRVEIIDEGGKR